MEPLDALRKIEDLAYLMPDQERDSEEVLSEIHDIARDSLAERLSPTTKGE